MREYNDIINLPYHVSKKNPQMSMWKRVAQFAPFAALRGTDEEIEIINNDIKKGSVVYGKNDNKKYTVVKVLLNRMLRLDDGSNKPQYDELSIEDVVIY